jgi:protein-S-isoprenylcysteine O-methyltransferase Ste14
VIPVWGWLKEYKASRCAHSGSLIKLPITSHLFSQESSCMKTASKKMSKGAFILNVVMTTLFFPAVTLLLAGMWQWTEGWIFGLWFSAMVLSSLVYLYLKDPELLAERSKAPGSDNQKGWDKVVLSATLLLAIVWLVIMPLDAKRFGWSPAFPLWLKVLGGLMLFPALFFIYRATVENTFLSTRVRIQSERKQRVISTGVYSFVRHPLYFGCVMMIVGSPMLLGSISGLIIGLIAIIILIGRIIGEEAMLVVELEGYTDYQKIVIYRLIPGIW